MKKLILSYLLSLIAFVILIGKWGKYIDSSTVIFCVIIIAISLVLLVLRLKNITKKLSKIIAISTTGISLVLISLLGDYDGSIFTRYNYFTARKDILKGNIQFVNFGYCVYTNDTAKKISRLVEEHFGYNTVFAGCHTLSMEYEIAEKYYNQRMRDYLEKKHGGNWEENSSKLYKSLFAIERDSSLSNIQKDSLITLRLKECKNDCR